jgi:Cu+-exporting ATPase
MTAIGRLNGWVNFGLALPVLLYSASDYFRQSWLGLRRRALTLDVPIALGVSRPVRAKHLRRGHGHRRGLFRFLHHADPAAAVRTLVPAAQLRRAFLRPRLPLLFPALRAPPRAEGDRSMPVAALQVGDRIVVRHQEIVPGGQPPALPRSPPGLQLRDRRGGAGGAATRATSSMPEAARPGPAVELEVLKETSQSYLASLWNHEAFRKNRAPGTWTP